MNKLDAFLVGGIVAAMIAMHPADAVELDKVVHASVSGAVAVVAAEVLADTDHPILYPFMVSFAAGVLKEVYDSRKGGTGFDKNDLAADAIGAGVGAVVGNQVYLFAVHRGIGVGVRGAFATGKAEGEK